MGKVIAPGGVGVTISSQSGWRMLALTAAEDELLATTPAEELLSLELLRPENIRDTLHAYQLAKHCNEKRVMAEAVKWGARLNDIAPGIIVTPWRWTSSTAPAGISTRICSPTVRRVAPERRTRSLMWQSSAGQQGRVYHRLHLPHRRRCYRFLFLWAAEAPKVKGDICT